MWKWLYPHYYVGSVLELTPERLRAINVECLLLDVDCTLKRYGHQEPEPEISAWINLLKSEGVALCLLSNGVASRIGAFAARVDLPFIAKACKPLPSGCRRAIRDLAVDPARTMLVGDQIFTDIAAGRLAGIRTTLTVPIAPEEEHWFTRIKRPFEKIVLRSFLKEKPRALPFTDE